MLKFIITVSMLLAGVFCQAQVSEIRNTGNFSEIAVGSGIQLIFTESNAIQVVKVEAANNEVLQQLITVSDGKRLTVSFKSQKKTTNTMKVFVAAKDIARFEAEKASQILLTNKVYAQDLKIILSSGAIFNGYVQTSKSVAVQASSKAVFNGRVETPRFSGDFSYGAKINVSGTAGIATIKGKSGAYCNGRNFITGQAKIDSDNATVIITNKEEIVVKAVEKAS